MTRADALKLYTAAEAGAGTEGARKRWRLACHALAPMVTDAKALALYATANATHKRADWRLAARALAVALDATRARPVTVKPERLPATLCEYLAASGGLCDRGGELASMGADRWHTAKAFRRRLVRADGMALDHAADLAHERGYLLGYAAPSLAHGGDLQDYHPATVEQLLEAIERELAGRPCYGAEDGAYIVPEWSDQEWEAAYPEDAPIYAEAA